MTFKTPDDKVKELLISLRPKIGTDEAEQIWQAYCLSDDKMKAELEEMISMMAYTELGNTLSGGQAFFAPPPRELAAGPYPLGNVIQNGQTLYPFALHDKEIGEHVSITGRSGAAKSTVLFHVLQGLLHKSPDVKLLAFDWKRELRALTLHPALGDKVQVYTVGRDIAPFQFNPLIPPPGTNITNHMEQLLDIICRCFYAGEGVFDILTRAIDSCYRDFKVYEGKALGYPTFRDIHAKIESFDLKGRQNEWKSSALRITRALGFGEFGNVVNTSGNNLTEILNQHTILELDSLPMAKRVFFVSALLAWLYSYSLGRKTNEADFGRTLNRVIVIEEAHNIALKHAAGARESILEQMIRQARFLGIGMILVDQTPSLLSSTVMANVHTSISLNQKNSGDISAAAANLLLDDKQREQLSLLRVGEAIVRLSDRHLTPFMIKTEIVPIKEMPVPDSALRRDTGPPEGGCFTYSPPEASETSHNPGDSAPDNITEDETRLLKDILEYPFIGVAKRYKKLFLSARKGNELKETLTRKGIVETEEINTGKASLMLLKPTALGLRLAHELGLEQKKPIDFRASLEHEYWRHKAATFCKALGYQVEYEAKVNGKTDIVARKDDISIAIEIETGKNNLDYAIGNIKKNLTKGFDRVISLVSEPAFLVRLQEQARAGHLDVPDVKIMPAHQFCAGNIPSSEDKPYTE
ncbi:MAG: hypothetical protein A2089_03805 [Elusimicrobia bacterium GWD2_63_28]|nr:MAG: hypothetical protein A2089_03805 [Elusimicrobia bacterium GWD2_63_28]